ncbi:MAG: ammonium transporter [Spirochaetia bacterium]|nr:ammonium transporter [Spirochaetia bacterium]
MDTANTTWLLVSAALVMLMTPGLAFFYGGMVRKKNVLGTLMHSFLALVVVSVVWMVAGYSLGFGPDWIQHTGADKKVYGFLGNLDWAFLKNVSFNPDQYYVSAGVPHMAYMIFQMMFAIITPALITGAFAERFKFSTYLVFLVLWSLLVYSPLAHVVWSNNGWLFGLGTLDFAGGLVVHMSSGFAALAAALLVGKRKGFGQIAMAANNPSYTILGAALLWFGWFGFNAGSAIASGALATSAFVTTHVATAAAGLTWMLAEWIKKKKPSAIGVASGAVAGLVAITPAAGFVSPMGALYIGLIAGVVCYAACHIKTLFGYDDSLDVVAVHGIGGAWGAIATGIFAGWKVDPSSTITATGLLTGNAKQLWIQIQSVGIVFVYSFVVTAIILLVLKFTMGLRVKETDEEKGLDESVHGEAL